MATPSATIAPEENKTKFLYRIFGEIQSTERTFHEELVSGLEKIEPYKEQLVAEGYDYEKLISPYQSLRASHGSVTLSDLAAFNSLDINEIISKACDSISEILTGKTLDAFAGAVSVYGDFTVLASKAIEYRNKDKPEEIGTHVTNEGQSLAILPIQRIPRYRLLVQELVKNAVKISTPKALIEAGIISPIENFTTPDAWFADVRTKLIEVGAALPEEETVDIFRVRKDQGIKSDTLRKLVSTLKEVMVGADLFNAARGKSEKELGGKLIELFGAKDKEIAEILVSRGYSLGANFDKTKQKEIAEEVAQTVRTGRPEDIDAVLKKNDIKATTEQGSQIKQDFYYSQIAPEIKEIIRIAGAKADFGITKENDFSLLRLQAKAARGVHSSTTGYIIDQINKEFEKSRTGGPKEQNESLKKIKGFLKNLGLDDSQAENARIKIMETITLATLARATPMPPPTQAAPARTAQPPISSEQGEGLKQKEYYSQLNLEISEALPIDPVSKQKVKIHATNIDGATKFSARMRFHASTTQFLIEQLNRARSKGNIEAVRKYLPMLGLNKTQVAQTLWNMGGEYRQSISADEAMELTKAALEIGDPVSRARASEYLAHIDIEKDNNHSKIIKLAEKHQMRAADKNPKIKEIENEKANIYLQRLDSKKVMGDKTTPSPKKEPPSTAPKKMAL